MNFLFSHFSPTLFIFTFVILACTLAFFNFITASYAFVGFNSDLNFIHNLFSKINSFWIFPSLNKHFQIFEVDIWVAYYWCFDVDHWLRTNCVFVNSLSIPWVLNIKNDKITIEVGQVSSSRWPFLVLNSMIGKLEIHTKGGYFNLEHHICFIVINTVQKNMNISCTKIRHIQDIS